MKKRIFPSENFHRFLCVVQHPLPFNNDQQNVVMSFRKRNFTLYSQSFIISSNNNNTPEKKIYAIFHSGPEFVDPFLRTRAEIFHKNSEKFIESQVLSVFVIVRFPHVFLHPLIPLTANLSELSVINHRVTTCVRLDNLIAQKNSIVTRDKDYRIFVRVIDN